MNHAPFKRCSECMEEIHVAVNGHEVDHMPSCSHYMSNKEFEHYDKPLIPEDSIAAMVRDFTAVGSRPKSEVRRRIEQAIEVAREFGQEEGRLTTIIMGKEYNKGWDKGYQEASEKAGHHFNFEEIPAQIDAAKSEDYQTALNDTIAAVEEMKWERDTVCTHWQKRCSCRSDKDVAAHNKTIEAIVTSLQSRRPETNNEK
jgi:hypothetical protein